MRAKSEPKLRQKKGNYYAEFYDPLRSPSTKTVTLRTKSKAAAVIRLGDFTRAYLYGDYDPWKTKLHTTPQRLTLQAAIEKFLESRASKSKKTVASYKETLRLLGAKLTAGIRLEEVAAADLKAFLSSGNWASATVRSHHTRLRAFFKWALKEKLVETNPISDIPPPTKEQSAAAYLKREEYKRMLEVAKETGQHLLADIIVFAVHTGLRRGEIINLRWQDVDLTKRTISIRNHGAFKTKTKQNRTVPLVGDAVGVLQRRYREKSAEQPYVFWGKHGGQVYGNYLSGLFRKCRKKAGVPESIHFHSMRHTFASWMALDGASLAVIQRVLGHSDISVTMVYSHLEQETLEREMSRVLPMNTTGEIGEVKYAYSIAAPPTPSVPQENEDTSERTQWEQVWTWHSQPISA